MGHRCCPPAVHTLDGGSYADSAAAVGDGRGAADAAAGVAGKLDAVALREAVALAFSQMLLDGQPNPSLAP